MEGWVAVLAAQPEVVVGFGRVSAPPYDRSLGHIPVFDPGPVAAT